MNPISNVLTLSPRVFLYPEGSPPSFLGTDCIALPQLAGSTAFGDGTHPTTRLCAGVVDLLCRQLKPQAVLDVGTGTGVLARIARERGAQFIVGTDIDSNALRSAREHSSLGGHPIEIQVSSEAPDFYGPRFNLVVANILEAPLRELAPALSRALAPNGVLLLSGFTRLQTPSLRVVFTSLGLTFVTESHLGEWALLMFTNKNEV